MKADLTVTEYSPESPLRNPLKLVAGLFTDLKRTRELTWILFLRDLKSQYRQSLLGYFWLLLPPFGTAVVWVILRSQKILQIETEIPYILYVLIGTTIWTSFIAFMNAPLNGFKNGKPVYTKLNVPAEAFIFSAILRVSFDTLIRLLALVPVFLLMKFAPSPKMFLFPLPLLCSFSIALAVGLLLVPIGVLFGDVSNAMSNITRFLMYTVPVVFPLGRQGWLNDIMEKNPLTPGVALFRDVLTNGSLEWAPLAILYGGIMVVVGFLALLLIRISKPHLISRMGM